MDDVEMDGDAGPADDYEDLTKAVLGGEVDVGDGRPHDLLVVH